MFTNMDLQDLWRWHCVNQIFVSLQASAIGIKALQEKRAALEKEVAHLKQKLGIEIKVQNNPSPRVSVVMLSLMPSMFVVFY